MSTLTLCSASAPKIAAAMPGRSGTRPQRDLRVVARVGDAGDILLFHDLVLVHHQRARHVGEARQHLNAHPLVHRQLDAAGLQHLGADRGQLQHLLVADPRELARLRHDARIGGVDAIDVGVDVAAVGLQRRRQRHGRGVRAAAAQRGDAVVGADALEAGHHGDLARCHAADQLRRPRCRRCAPCRGRCRCGSGSASPARSAPRRRVSCSAIASRPVVTCSPVATTVSYSRASCSGDRPWQYATSWLVTPGHGGDHDGDLVPRVDLALHAGRDVADAVEVGDRGAAELHHDA